MFRIFQRNTQTSKNLESKSEPIKRSYIGVASPYYGGIYDLTPLVMGELDEDFKNDFRFKIAIGMKKFDDFKTALRTTSRRGVAKDSAFVIGLKCSVDEIDSYRECGQFSKLIVSITNATTYKHLANDFPLIKVVELNRKMVNGVETKFDVKQIDITKEDHAFVYTQTVKSAADIYKVLNWCISSSRLDGGFDRLQFSIKRIKGFLNRESNKLEIEGDLKQAMKYLKMFMSDATYASAIEAIPASQEFSIEPTVIGHRPPSPR
jgi:hypothetical protein